MNFKRIYRLTVLLILLFFISCIPIWSLGHQEGKEEQISDFLDKIDTDFAYDIAMRLTDPILFNSKMGGRQAGSEAEQRTADVLVSMMKEVGLKNVAKESFPVDTWQFNDSTLSVITPAGEVKKIKPYAYAFGGTSSAGITAELVYANEGTMYDYEKIDVKGKIVLIDIDMYDYWWIEYPTIEAELNGAAAIINSCKGGYAQVNDDAMNSQDSCGPLSIPSVNISRNDANYLKSLLEEGEVIINLQVDNIVKEGGTSYNIIGEIPGETDEIILIGDHYDTHFWGFNDNSCAVAMVLSIAKNLVDIGYKPQKTLKFVLHGAEEWGAIDTRYDWAIGAWHMVNTMHPEWTGQALAFFNFEHPAHTILDPSYYVNSAPELNMLIDCFNDSSAPDLTWKYPEGFSDKHYHISSWTDSFSYNQAGIPATCNARSTKTKDRSKDFGALYYHSQFDNPETWEGDVFQVNMEYYGSLIIDLDNTPVLKLDFTAQADRLSESIDESIFSIAGADPGPLQTVIDEFRSSGERLNKQIISLNDLYLELVQTDASGRLLQQIKDSGYTANRKTLKAFKIFQDELYRLNWADSSIFEHEHAQKNLALMTESVEKLKNGEVDYVVDELLWDIELHWYSYYFSKENIQHHINQVFSPENADNLFWGKGRIVGVTDLWDTVQSLNNKYGNPGADFSAEIADLERNILEQKKMMKKAVYAEISSIPKVTAILNQIDLSEVIAKAEKAVE